MNQETFYHNLRDKKSSSILIELKKFTSETFPKFIAENVALDNISNEYQDFVYKIVNTYSKMYFVYIQATSLQLKILLLLLSIK